MTDNFTFSACVPQKLDFPGDLSADRYIVLHRPEDRTKAVIAIGCTAVDTPIGVLSYELTNSSTATVGAQPTNQFSATLFTSGTSKGYYLEIEVPTALVILRWDVTSGGAGDYLRNAEVETGSKPTIVWRA